MTVGELKKKLENVDDDLPVWVCGSDQCASEAEDAGEYTDYKGLKRFDIEA